MKIVFIVPGTEGRSKFLNGDSIRTGGAAASGTDQSAILIAEHLASIGNNVTVVFHKTDKKEVRGVKYTCFDFEGIDNEVDILISNLWFSEYENLPFKINKGLIYIYHMAWVYGINEMTDYCLKHNIPLGLINVSEWAKNQNKWSIELAELKLPIMFSEVIPNPIMTDLIEELISENHVRVKRSFIFHAQYGRGGDVVYNALKELEWDEELQRMDYVDPATGVDKSQLFTKLLQSEYFVFPLFHPNGCVYKDTFSCAVAEALATGVTVLTYPLGAIPEHFGDYCFFLDFPEETDLNKMFTENVTCDAWYMNSTTDVKRKLLQLETSSKKEEIRNKSFNYIKENFSVPVIGRKWEKFLSNFHESV